VRVTVDIDGVFLYPKQKVLCSIIVILTNNSKSFPGISWARLAGNHNCRKPKYTVQVFCTPCFWLP